MGTFSEQAKLPSLPVPDLNETLEKYLKSAEVFLDDNQKAKTRQIIEKFRRSGLAQQLQKALLERAKNSRNWLEEWWYDSYLEMRTPLVPFVSMISAEPLYMAHSSAQLYRAADFIHHMMNYWITLRREQIPVARRKGSPLDMNQYYVLFNANRTPGIPMDINERHFRTENEGPSPTHCIILYHGNIWSLDGIQDGQPAQSDCIFHQLEHIMRESEWQKYSVASLTTEKRDIWRNLRKHLRQLSPQNTESLDEIEKAVFSIALTDETFESPEQVLLYTSTGKSDAQWADKSLNVFFHRDGRCAILMEHSNGDAIAIMDIINTVIRKARKDPWDIGPKVKNCPMPKKLEFVLDKSTENAITVADESFKTNGSSVSVAVFSFKKYGNDKFKSAGLYGDTVVQMALQLAFYRTHQRLAPTYETASTRAFYHGRTETVRSCTLPLAQFVRQIILNEKENQVRTAAGRHRRLPFLYWALAKFTVIGITQLFALPYTLTQFWRSGLFSGKASKSIHQKLNAHLKKLFLESYTFHNELMKEATQGRGCDRHLYGLQKIFQSMPKDDQIQKEENVFLDIFRDPAWKLSGGDGNFLLSTSFLGYDLSAAYGCVAPMRDGGYGIFYKIGPNQIGVVISVFKTSKDSNVQEFASNLEWAFEYLSQFLVPSDDVAHAKSDLNKA